MIMTEIEVDLSTLEMLDFEHTPACEGQLHAVNLFGHQADEPAKSLMVTPCCGTKLLVCEPRRKFIIAGGAVYCGDHNRVVQADEIKFLPID